MLILSRRIGYAACGVALAALYALASCSAAERTRGLESLKLASQGVKALQSAYEVAAADPNLPELATDLDAALTDFEQAVQVLFPDTRWDARHPSGLRPRSQADAERIAEMLGLGKSAGDRCWHCQSTYPNPSGVPGRYNCFGCDFASCLINSSAGDHPICEYGCSPLDTNHLGCPGNPSDPNGC